MTHQEFSEQHDVLVVVGKLSNISSTEDGPRDFLEAITSFRIAQSEGAVSDAGYNMPSFEGVILPPIIDIDFVPDFYGASDGYIVVHPA